MRFISVFLLCALIASLHGCGGGSGSAPASSSSTTVASPANAAPNVMAVTVELGPSNNVNIPYVTVTVCEPGSDVNCRTIDHVLVDTGSNGLRLFASALAATASQPALSFPLQSASGGGTLAECVQFADGSSVWGAVKLADVKLAGQRVSSLPVHVVGDAGFAPIPNACSNSLTPATTPAQFGANGVLGVGFLDQDCGEVCRLVVQNGFYYACTSNCSPSTASLAQQVPNPVARLANDNNGVVLKLPGVAAGGAATVSGSLIFGIGTQANNALGAAKVFNLDPTSSYITTIYKNHQYTQSFIDSGSNAIYFDDAGINICTGYDHGFYCPPSTVSLTATMVGAKVGSTDAASGLVSFSVANADNLFHANPSFVAFPTLAGPMSAIDNTAPDTSWSSYFDWGLPFFYGRSVFTAIRGRGTPAGQGPYYAY